MSIDEKIWDQFAVAPASDATQRQPWHRPQLTRLAAAEAQSAPGPGADSGFVVS